MTLESKNYVGLTLTIIAAKVYVYVLKEESHIKQYMLR